MNQTRKDVLNGWKEIGAYLGRDPRTVERWEKQRSLPVRRLPGTGRATVYALVPELDAWLSGSPVTEGPMGVETLTARIAQLPDTPDPPAPVVIRPEPGYPGAMLPRPWLPLRWAAPLVGLLVLCFIATAAVAWKRRHMKSLPAAVATSDRGHRLVPTSPVYGVEELYLRGSFQAEIRTPESLHRAQQAFSAAIGKDPAYAPAYAGLASTYLLLREYSMLPDAEAYPKAMEAAGKALALRPDLPQAHAVQGFGDFFWRWDAAAAERQFRTALALDPDLPLSHHWYGSVLTHEGRFREGLAELSVAQKLDPGSAAILTMRALALGLNGGSKEAAEMLQGAISNEKAGQYRNPATMHHVLGTLSLVGQRDVSRFLAEERLGAELRQDKAGAAAMRLAAAVYRKGDEAAMWRQLLADERARHGQNGPTYAMARYEVGLGHKDQALDDLLELYRRHDPALIGVTVDPLLVPLRRDPRFLQLRASMGLPEADQGVQSTDQVPG